MVEFWFDGQASVADAQLSVWNEEYQAYELQAALVNGSPALLKSPFYQKTANSFEKLVHEIMQPLQKKLIESGFDGLVWQAGLGNPVAANNFLYGERWLWIDLESGVPALVPLNPVPLFTFYLPKCWRHRCALFDDVDIEKLQNYLQKNQEALIAFYGQEQFSLLVAQTTTMGNEQCKWKKKQTFRKSADLSLEKAENFSTTETILYEISTPLVHTRNVPCFSTFLSFLSFILYQRKHLYGYFPKIT